MNSCTLCECGCSPSRISGVLRCQLQQPHDAGCPFCSAPCRGILLVNRNGCMPLHASLSMHDPIGRSVPPPWSLLACSVRYFTPRPTKMASRTERRCIWKSQVLLMKVPVHLLRSGVLPSFGLHPIDSRPGDRFVTTLDSFVISRSRLTLPSTHHRGDVHVLVGTRPTRLELMVCAERNAVNVSMVLFGGLPEASSVGSMPRSLYNPYLLYNFEQHPIENV